MSNKVKILWGVPYPSFVSKEFQDILEKYDVNDLDTGGSYPGSEQGIGDAGLAGKYNIHTKSYGYTTGSQSYHGILNSAAESLKRLGTKQVETYLLHTPDPANPISETLDAIQKLYKDGVFENFGLSNFLPTQVQEVHSYCLSKSYVLPTVYEGHYNPVGRHAETELFPLLRKLGISYNAYAALAGGFLTKTPDFFTSDASTGTRWDKSSSLGKLYNSVYNKPKLLEGLNVWDEISKESGISKPALSYRWVAYNSALSAELGDGVIIGAMSSEHLGQTLEWLKDGPLDEKVVKRIDELWEMVKTEAAFDNFNL